MDTDNKSPLLKPVTEWVLSWGIWGILLLISGIGTSGNFSTIEKVGAGVGLFLVARIIVLFVKSGSKLHITMIAAMLILTVVFVGILIRHYWFLFFVWLTLPFAALWLAGDIMRPRLSLELHRTIREVLVSAAFVLAIVNLSNMGNLRLDFGKRFIDGYQITTSHNCEEDAEGTVATNGSLSNGDPPGTCKIENLSEVAPSWQWALGLSDFGFFILAFIIVVGTWLIGKSTVGRMSREEQE